VWIDLAVGIPGAVERFVKGLTTGEGFPLTSGGAEIVSIKWRAATTLLITSLVLSVVVTMIWAISYFHGDNFDVGRHTWSGPVGVRVSQDAWHLMWGRGGVSIWRTYLHYPPSMAEGESANPDGQWHLGHSSVQPNRYAGNFGLFFRGRDEGRVIAGFGYVARPKEIIWGARYHAIILPFPFILLVVAAPALRWLYVRRRRLRRERLGLCWHCGYDLRESPGKCPECGAAIGQLLAAEQK